MIVLKVKKKLMTFNKPEIDREYEVVGETTTRFGTHLWYILVDSVPVGIRDVECDISWKE